MDVDGLIIIIIIIINHRHQFIYKQQTLK